MPSFNRRAFLESSVGGFAALTLGSRAFGAEDEKAEKKDDAKKDDKEKDKPKPGGAPQSPHDSLFLTWQRDPTTKMTVQWVGEAVGAEDSGIAYAPLESKVWRAAQTLTHPFPATRLHVYRCELTGLEPGGEYKFRVGGRDDEYRFRTRLRRRPTRFASSPAATRASAPMRSSTMRSRRG